MSKNLKIPSALLVSRSNAKKGDVWNAAAQGRFYKQHGDVDELPENDAHAIRKIQDPTYRPPVSEEEAKAAESALTKKINDLKAQGSNPVTLKTSNGNFYDEWTD